MGRHNRLPDDRHLEGVEELCLVGLNPLPVLGLLDDAEERLERGGVGKGQLGDRVVVKVGLAAEEHGGRVVGVALGALGLAGRALDVAARVRQGKVLAGHFLDDGDVGFVAGPEFFRRGAGLAVCKDEDAVSHCGGLRCVFFLFWLLRLSEDNLIYLEVACVVEYFAKEIDVWFSWRSTQDNLYLSSW